MAAEDTSVAIAPDFAAQAQAATHIWAKAISDGSYKSDLPKEALAKKYILTTTTINAESQENDTDSTLNYFRTLIQLRKKRAHTHLW